DSIFNRFSEKELKELNEKYHLGKNHVDARKDTVASLAYKAARVANDVEQWNEYIARYTFSSLLDSAIANRNLLAWSLAKKENTSAAYSAFLTSYPLAVQSADAHKRYEETLYREKTSVHTEEAFAEFVASHSTSPYRTLAEDSLFFL